MAFTTLRQLCRQGNIVPPQLSLPTHAGKLPDNQTYEHRNIVPPQLSLPSHTGFSSGAQRTLTSFPIDGVSQRETQNSLPIPFPSPEKDAEEQASEQTRSSSTRGHAPFHHRRVPEMRQMAAAECGAACLAMILNYYGHATTIASVHERCGVGRDGLSARAIARAAHQYGLDVRAISVQENDLSDVPLPAIIHWELNHFVVLERWSSKRAEIVDPAAGRRRLSAAEFDEGFTGVLIMLSPGSPFKRQALQRSLTLWIYLRSLLHMRGVAAQILLASLLLQIFGLGLPFLTEVLVNSIIPTRATNLLLMLGIGMLLLLLTRAVTLLLRALLLIHLQTRVSVQMMLSFFEHLLSLSYRFFQARLIGDLLARAESNEAIRDLLTNRVLATMLDSSTVLVYFVVLLIQSPLIAGVTVVIGAFQVGILLLTASPIRRLTQRNLMAQGKAEGYLNETLSGIATLKAAGAEQRAFHRWKMLFTEQMNISLRRSYFLSSISVVFDAMQFLAPLLLLWLGALEVINGALPLGTMLAINALASQFLTPLSSLATSGQQFQIAQAHFERIADVMEAEPEQNPRNAYIFPKLTGHIELSDVSFQYSPNTPPALHNLQVRIRAGQKVAIIGKSGSGKSTLGKLFIGLLSPTKGDIFFDDIPLSALNYHQVRRQFGVVLQDSFIFSGSIRENIALNNPGMSLSTIIEAAQMAGIHEEIIKMPMKYETLVAEGGSALSGGQRQRLALARALANNPKILLLDEATSALDVVTERAVEEHLRKLSCTSIVIAHRLSTIYDADLILVLDEGRIVAQGTHEKLLRSNSYYATLIRMQMASEEAQPMVS